MSQILHQPAETLAEVAAASIAPTDGELLMCFVHHQTEEAFAGLVDRHAPMVMRVCTQILCDRHEAEDAVQATFLVLAQRAQAIRKMNSVASWLHGVAYRTATRILQQRRRRNTAPLDDVEAPTDEVWTNIAKREQLAILHYELDRLPERLRAPLVLCYLEGKTRQQAAEELDCTDASVKDKLVRGRRMLRSRMARRGVMFSAAFTAASLTTSACDAASVASLTSFTTEAITSSVLAGNHDLISTTVRSLAEYEMQTWSLVGLAKCSFAASWVLAAGIGWSVYTPTAGDSGNAHAAARTATEITLESEFASEAASLASMRASADDIVVTPAAGGVPGSSPDPHDACRKN